MIRVGITGQSGFIGSHLFNYLRNVKGEIECIPFRDDYFTDPGRLVDFVSQCDAIVHLAGVNRHSDPQFIYDTNIDLVNRLINAISRTGTSPHVLFASSTQEERDNIFGKSKREGRKLLAGWAEKSGGTFTGMVIPNVFGPFGNPYYNSVVATFSHQLTHDEQPRIEVDAQLKLIYIADLVKIIYYLIINRIAADEYRIPPTDEATVSEILTLLQSFKIQYFEQGVVPNLSDPFERNLFNTFVCYIDHQEYFPFQLKLNTDDRGSFVETVKANSGGQVSFSTTKPGITRGNHFHTRKAERFAVIRGRARIQIRRIGSDQVHEFHLDGSRPAFVDMPIWHTHNITNTGEEDLYTIFWISELYDPGDPDTYFEKV
ncbi:MAG TPA: NAD-dependent epimerase/dehydratase family protein [Bacteroidales bacterium]|nr:NAD-dependent epimerase/dehydratase family protein [Bacteroidales bacterium]